MVKQTYIEMTERNALLADLDKKDLNKKDLDNKDLDRKVMRHSIHGVHSARSTPDLVAQFGDYLHPMSARMEVERHQLSLDSKRPQYQKRSTSFSILRNYQAADIEVQDEPPIIVETLQVPAPQRRQKSVSVCIAALPTSSSPPRTIAEYEQQAVRNGLPQSLSAYDLHEVRLPALSTSEVFNEPPSMYVYKPRPQVSIPYMRRRQRRTPMEFIKKHKHTIAAWACGFAGLSAIVFIVIFDINLDLH